MGLDGVSSEYDLGHFTGLVTVLMKVLVTLRNTKPRIWMGGN